MTRSTSSGQAVRVLVVDDSAVQRQILIDLLKRDRELEVVGWAANGADALRLVEQLKPDVVTLDERMPGMSGIETARRIMGSLPTPIVMVTSTGGVRARDVAEAALEAGVLAVQDKCGLSPTESAAAAELVRVVKSMASVRLVRRRRVGEPNVPAASGLRTPEIVAIGASTGGPQAIRAIVANLPADFGLPLVIVQHTTRGYAHTLVDWLRAETPLPISIAEHGQPLNRPGIVIAPSDRHLVVEGRRLELNDAPPSSLHKPSATVLFQSVARTFGRSAVGVLLTGMGDDGADGLKEMHDAGALTIAQDEASCVVFGMPAQAIRLGAADHVLPPERIAAMLLEQLPGRGVAA